MSMSMSQTQADSEIWLNTANGVRWFKALDLYGRETTKTVNGGRTFTITTFERQLNQDSVASPEQDLFRNGTFVLRKAGDNTNQEEVRSPNSLTDTEISGLVMELVHGSQTPVEVLEGITSDVTMRRVLEALVAEDAPKEVLGYVKERTALLAGATKPAPSEPATPVITRPDEDDEGFNIVAEVAADSGDTSGEST